MPAIRKTALVLVLAGRGLARAQAPDITGEWSVVRRPAVSESSSPSEDWLRALPGAVFTLSHSEVPPLAMVRKNLGYRYSPSLATITISQGQPEKPQALGFLQAQGGRRFEGELAFSSGCWTHLSLEESEEGSSLSGSARINTKISTRACRSTLVEGVKKGEPFSYTLIRLR